MKAYKYIVISVFSIVLGLFMMPKAEAQYTNASGYYQYYINNTSATPYTGQIISYNSKSNQVGGTGRLNSGGSYTMLIVGGTLTSTCSTTKVKITSTYANSGSGTLYCFKTNKLPNSNSGSVTLGELVYKVDVSFGTGETTFSGSIGSPSTQYVIWIYVPTSNPTSNHSHLISVHNTNIQSLTCNDCVPPTLNPTNTNDGCSAAVALNSGSNGGSGCSGSWEYAWKNNSNMYWNGSSFGSGSAVYNSSYSNINVTQTINTTNTYSVYARCSANASCASTTKSTTVAINNVAPVLADIAPQQACEGTPFSVTATETAGASGVTYVWSGVASGTGQTINFTPTDGGTLTVVATNKCGDADTKTTTITVNKKSTPTNLTVSVCQSNDSYTYNSDFADIDISNAGVLNLSKTLTNVAGCDSVVNLEVTVNEVKTTVLNIDKCQSETSFDYDANFTNIDLRSAGLQTFTKKFNSASNCDSIVTLNVNVHAVETKTVEAATCISETPYTYDANFTNIDVSTAGVKTITKVLTSVAGCDSTVTLNVTVNDKIKMCGRVDVCVSNVPFNYDENFSNIDVSTAGEQRLEKTFTAASGCDSIVCLTVVAHDVVTAELHASTCINNQPYTYNADFTDIDVSTEGVKTVTKTLVSSYGCDSVVTLYVNVREKITTNLEATVCQSYSPYDYDSEFAHIDISNPGIKQVEKTFVSAMGCDSVVTLNLTVVENTLTVSLGEDLYFCKDEPFTLTATTNEANVSLLWSTGETSSSINGVATQTTVYSVEATNQVGCTASDQQSIIVTTMPAVQISDNGGSFCNESSIRLTASLADGSAADTYQWNNGDTTPSIEISNDGFYSVVVEKNGCVDSTSIEVEPCACNLRLANAFTPDGDGKNDTYHPLMFGVFKMEMNIYNRWGKLVFSTTNLDGSWDGTDLNGTECPPAVYFCVVTYTCADGDHEVSTSVTIIR